MDRQIYSSVSATTSSHFIVITQYTVPPPIWELCIPDMNIHNVSPQVLRNRTPFQIRKEWAFSSSLVLHREWLQWHRYTHIPDTTSLQHNMNVHDISWYDDTHLILTTHLFLRVCKHILIYYRSLWAIWCKNKPVFYFEFYWSCSTCVPTKENAQFII